MNKEYVNEMLEIKRVVASLKGRVFDLELKIVKLETALEINIPTLVVCKIDVEKLAKELNKLNSIRLKKGG